MLDSFSPQARRHGRLASSTQHCLDPRPRRPRRLPRTSLATASLATSVADPVTSAPHSPDSSLPPAPPPHSPTAATRAVRRMTRRWCRTRTSSARSGGSPRRQSGFLFARIYFFFCRSGASGRGYLPISPHITPFLPIGAVATGRGCGEERALDALPLFRYHSTRNTDPFAQLSRKQPCSLVTRPRRTTPRGVGVGERGAGEGMPAVAWRTTGASMVSSSSRPPASCLLFPSQEGDGGGSHRPPAAARALLGGRPDVPRQQDCELRAADDGGAAGAGSATPTHRALSLAL